MALQNIVLADGQATPVNRTFEVFTPQVASDPALLYQKAAGVTKLNERMTLLQRRANGSTSFRTQLSVHMPRVVDQTAGVVQTGHIDISIVLPDGFTAAMRADIAAYLKNLAASAVIQDAIKNVTSFA